MLVPSRTKCAYEGSPRKLFGKGGRKAPAVSGRLKLPLKSQFKCRIEDGPKIMFNLVDNYRHKSDSTNKANGNLATAYFWRERASCGGGQCNE